MTVRSTLSRNWRVFKHFMHKELLILSKSYSTIFINSLSWPFCTGIVFGYIMPHVGGMGNEFGSMVIVSTVTIIILYTGFGSASMLSMDFDGERRINYELCLPVSPYMLFFIKGCVIAAKTFIQIIPLPILSKLLLYDRFPLTNISLPKIGLMYVVVCMMYAFINLAIAGLVRSARINDFRVRVIDQMMFLGCFMFSWAQLFEISRVGAYLNLLNPAVYAAEASRAAFFGPRGSLPFWWCAAALIGFALLFYRVSLVALKRRLDFVTFER